MTDLPPIPDRFSSVAEAASWARFALASASPRAARVMRERTLPREHRGRAGDRAHWARIDAAVQQALTAPPALQEDWTPPADDLADADAVDERTLALARARTRARLERARRAANG